MESTLTILARNEQSKAELELFRALADSDEDVRMGRVEPNDDTFDSLRRMLLEQRV